MSKDEWMKLRIKMFKKGITFSSVASHHSVSRQRIHQVIKKGYPAKNKAKEILDDFYGRFNE